MNKVCYKKYEQKKVPRYHIGEVRRKLKMVRAELIKLNGEHLIKYSVTSYDGITLNPIRSKKL
jgi:hypothetical protein